MTTLKPCLQCGGALGPGDRFCAQCGAELLWCTSCGEFLLQADELCPKCGAPGTASGIAHTMPYVPTEDDSPWADVIARLRRATQGEFEIGRELGRGGMAVVFHAHEISLHRDVAIKVMSPAMLMGEGMIERFKREAITIAHLNHPNIVSVYSVRAGGGLHFFVMRCIKGRSLEQLIKEVGKLPIPIVRSILAQVGSALAYAHRFRIIHRDIKPANILIDDEGNAVVTDFGIAKAAEAPSHTHSGFMVGTPAYMSPEQCSGGEVSGASDQYSLGAVAYEMIAGVPPFTGSTYSIIQAHVEQPPRPLREQVADCPPDLEAAILRMLAKNPADRWPGISQALSALGAVALLEDDPLRSDLIRMATGGGRSDFPTERTPAPKPQSDSSGALHATPPGMVRAITILPPPPSLEVGDSFLLVARVHESQGEHLPRRAVEWSSDAPGVLRVNATRAVATAISPGTALIRASCEGKEGRLRVTVSLPRADVIVIRPPDQAIGVGDEVRLEATARDKRGRLVSRPVTWLSQDDTVATVSLDGVLVARSAGSTRIIAELDEVRADVAISVTPARVAAVHISALPETVTAGDSFALTATPLDHWGEPLPERLVTWTVSDVGVAVVTAAGWVMTRAPGAVTLTAMCEGVSAVIVVNVLAPAAAPLRAKLAARPTSAGPDSWDIDPLAEAAAEPISSPRRLASRPLWLVAAAGTFFIAGGFWLAQQHRLPPGAFQSATAEDDVARPATSVLDTNAPVVGLGRPASLAITRQPSGAIVVGNTDRLEAAVQDSVGHVLPEASITWSSSNPAIASVNSSDGVVQAIRPGRAAVVAAAGDWRDTAHIVVRDSSSNGTQRSRRVASLSITPRSPLRVGDTASLEATALDHTGHRIRSAKVQWSSSRPTVVEIDRQSGSIRARSAGTALIIAQSGSESDLTELTVLPAAVGAVEIEGAHPLKVGEELALQARVADAWGTPLEGRTVVWSSGDTTVAVVESASGFVVARGPGRVEISATSEGKAGRVAITVIPPPRIGRPEEPKSEPAAPTPEEIAAREQRLLNQMVTGVDQCYDALQRKDVTRVVALYQPANKADREKLKKLTRILETREWDAFVGAREDGDQRIGSDAATMEFQVTLNWKDAFGGRVRSRPDFQAEFARDGDRLNLLRCRIIGSPRL